MYDLTIFVLRNLLSLIKEKGFAKSVPHVVIGHHGVSHDTSKSPIV